MKIMRTYMERTVRRRSCLVAFLPHHGDLCAGRILLSSLALCCLHLTGCTGATVYQ